MNTSTIPKQQASRGNALNLVAELWRRAVLGDRAARRELLRQIIPRRRG